MKSSIIELKQRTTGEEIRAQTCMNVSKKSGDLVDCVMQFLLLKHEHVNTHRAISNCHIKRLIVTCKQQLELQTIIPYTGIIMSIIQLYYILMKIPK